MTLSREEINMTVKELIDTLSQYPPDMEVVTMLHSAYVPLEAPTIKPMLYNPSNYAYLTYYPSLHKEPPDNLVEVVYFTGN